MPTPTLLCTIGLPRSGKTTWSRTTGYPIVNPDSIRYALHGERFNALMEPYMWAMAKTMVRALFLAGHSFVVLDATNGTKARRQEWMNADWQTHFVYFNTSVEECIVRATVENDTYIIPVILRMAAAWEAPEAHELAAPVQH